MYSVTSACLLWLESSSQKLRTVKTCQCLFSLFYDIFLYFPYFSKAFALPHHTNTMGHHNYEDISPAIEENRTLQWVHHNEVHISPIVKGLEYEI